MYNFVFRRTIWSVTLVVIAFSGCSSSVFTGNKKGELSQIEGVGQFNRACLGLDLSRSALDVPTARSLVNCLNSNRSIQAYQDLTASMSDAQLNVFLETVNRSLLLNYVRLKQVDRSFSQMAARGVLDRTFVDLSKVLANGPAIRALGRLLNAASFDRSGKLDPSILTAIQILAKEIAGFKQGQERRLEARNNLRKITEASYAAASLKSFKKITAGFRSEIGMAERRSLDRLVQLAFEYARIKTQSNKSYIRPMLWGLVDGSAFTVFDHFLFSQCEESSGSSCDRTSMLHSRTKSAEVLLRLLAETGELREKFLSPLVSLYGQMDQSIFCMGDTKYIPNADMFVMNELSQKSPLDVPAWLLGSNMMKLKLATSLCKLPGDGAFNALIQVLRAIAGDEYEGQGGRGRPMVTLTQLMKGMELADQLQVTSPDAIADLQRFSVPLNERYRRMAIQLLGDRGESVNIATHLGETLGELSREKRDILGNLFYFMSVPETIVEGRDKPLLAREDISSVAEIIMRPRAELSGKSLYEVGASIFAERASWRDLYDLLSSFSDYVDSSEDILRPLLKDGYEVLLFNNVNPLVEVALDIGAAAGDNQDFLRVMIQLMDTPQFQNAAELTAKMAKNGTLRELLQGMLNMYSGTTSRVPGEPEILSVPELKQVSSLRDLSTEDRPATWSPLPVPFPGGTRPTSWLNACSALDLDLKFSDTKSSRWDDQAEKLASCIDDGGDNREVRDLINYARAEKLPSGKPIAPFLVDLLAGIVPSDAVSSRIVYDELSDILLDPLNFRDMKYMNTILPLVFEREYCGIHSKDPSFVCPSGIPRVSVAQALLRAMATLSAKQNQLQEVFDFLQPTLENPKLPKALALMRDKVNEADAITDPIVADEKPPLVSYPINTYPQNRILEERTKLAIRKYELREPTSDVLAEKAAEYYKQPSSWQRKVYQDGFDQNGKPRWRYGYRDSEEFKRDLKPLLDELARSNRIEWLMTFLYTMDANPYTPEWWSRWFRQATKQVKPIPYYYPGTFPPNDKPTVRLVSQLDLLELVVVDADFTLNDLGNGKSQALGFLFGDADDNFAIKYLTRLALTRIDKNPNALTNAVDAMGRELRYYNWLGSDGLFGGALEPEVRRRLFNLLQVFPILEDMNKAVPYTGPDGKVIVANDLGVLRDMFYSLVSSAPRDTWNLYRKEVSGLAVITEMVKFGLLRNITANMWYVNRDSNKRSLVHIDQDDQDANHHEIVPQKISHLLRFAVDAAVDITPTYRRINPDALRILSHLLREDCSRSLPYFRSGCVVVGNARDKNEVFNERYRLVGKLVDQIFEWTKNDDKLEDSGKTKILTLIKRAGYEALELADQLRYVDGKSLDLNKLATKVLRPILGTPEGTQMIGENLDLVESVFTEQSATYFFKLLQQSRDSATVRGDRYYAYTDADAYKDLRDVAVDILHKMGENDAHLSSTLVDIGGTFFHDPAAVSAKSALKWLKDDPDYDVEKNVPRILDQVFHWIALEPTPERSRLLRPRMMSYLGTQLTNGNIRDLATFIGTRSHSDGPAKDELYQKLRFLGKPEYQSKLDSFMELMRSGIQDYNWQKSRR